MIVSVTVQAELSDKHSHDNASYLCAVTKYPLIMSGYFDV